MMSTIDGINYTVGDETGEPPRLRRLAAPGAAVFCPAGESPVARRPAAALAGAVSPAAPGRARPADPDGAARRDARLRRVERDGPGEPATIAGAGCPPHSP